MKITITGSLGHISKPLAEELIQKGHTVTVISHSPERQKDIEALGAKAAIGSVEDVTFLTSAFAGADAVYTMIPPSSSRGIADPSAGNDFSGIINRVNNLMSKYAEAIQLCGVKRVVQLSSIGAHMEKDSGLILLYLGVERILDELQDVDVTFMRPVGFYYNLLGFIPAIKSTGMMASNYGGDDIIPWVSPLDIAASIVEELETSPVRRKIRYVASEELSCNEVAGILGEAIGKPDLKWNLISDEQLKNGMIGAGVVPALAAGLVEMQASMHNGDMYKDYYKNKPVLGKVKLKEYAKEFASAFNS